MFTANMTGNTVLLAVAAVRDSAADALRSVTALGGFAVGVALGAAIVGQQGEWPRRAAAIFWAECLLLAILLILWVILGHSARYGLIVLAAAAMGCQSVAVRASHIRGVQTTYMTSTFQNAVARFVLSLRGARDHNDGSRLPGSAWMIYGVGALAGALAESGWGLSCLAVPLGIVAAVAITATRNGHPRTARE